MDADVILSSCLLVKYVGRERACRPGAKAGLQLHYRYFTLRHSLFSATMMIVAETRQ
jgi:hypothetical protein